MSSTPSATDPPRWASAFAPASVGNVAIGFDILGFSVGALGDRVTVSRTEGAAITDITGWQGSSRWIPEND